MYSIHYIMALKPDQQCQVILVDDDEDDFYLLKQGLQTYSKQISVRHMTDDTELFAHLEAAKPLPNLILLDIRMPVMDGFHVLNLLKQNFAYQTIPVVIWSGHLADEEITRCYVSGANSVILKQTLGQSLSELVSTICTYWFASVALPPHPDPSAC